MYEIFNQFDNNLFLAEHILRPQELDFFLFLINSSFSVERFCMILSSDTLFKNLAKIYANLPEDVVISEKFKLLLLSLDKKHLYVIYGEKRTLYFLESINNINTFLYYYKTNPELIIDEITYHWDESFQWVIEFMNKAPKEEGIKVLNSVFSHKINPIFKTTEWVESMVFLAKKLKKTLSPDNMEYLIKKIFEDDWQILTSRKIELFYEIMIRRDLWDKLQWMSQQTYDILLWEHRDMFRSLSHLNSTDIQSIVYTLNASDKSDIIVLFDYIMQSWNWLIETHETYQRLRNYILKHKAIPKKRKILWYTF